MITIYSLASEMQSFVNVSKDTLAKAKKSKINNDNSVEFTQIVCDWQDGMYDEDPDYVVSEIENLL